MSKKNVPYPPAGNPPVQRISNAVLFVGTAFGAAASLFGLEAAMAIRSEDVILLTGSALGVCLPIAGLSGLIAMDHIAAS